MRRRLLIVIAGALVAALAVFAATRGPDAVRAIDRERDDDGPLRTEINAIEYGAVASNGFVKGERFTDGLIAPLQFKSNHPITIESVTSAGGENALRFLGAKVVPYDPPRPYAGFDVALGWPPEKHNGHFQGLGKPMFDYMKDAIPAEGAVLEPVTRNGKTRNEPTLLLGYEVIASEQALRHTVTIEYRVDDDEYRESIHIGLTYCPRTRGLCPENGAIDKISELMGEGGSAS